MCEKCLYRKNCQFLATHENSIVESCTAYKSETDLRAEVAREIFDLIEDECLAYPIQEGHPTILVDARNYNELKKKYTEEK